MTWSFNLNLDSKPLVLAGPILRRVTPVDATVWLALRKPATVTLTIRDAQGAIFTGSRQTCAVGKNLHIVAVTAGHLATGRGPGAQLLPGVIYSYDMVFDTAGGQLGQTLAAATGDAALSYAPYSTPTFCMPPTDPNKLRLIHGSCRHSNGINGTDCLSLLSGLISETAQDPDRRPHQLFLTGDQIYADDVAAAFLMLLTAASDQLLGWQEVLPIAAGPLLGQPRPGNQIPPYFRARAAKIAGFTSDAADNHLFSLGEYLCMYLFVWSDVLWQASDLPGVKDVQAAYLALMRSQNAAFPLPDAGELRKVRKETAKNTGYTTTFRQTIGEVRRALANIPTYMILDDHDVTDDFHMTRRICEGVYGNAMGQRVVQNALVAYALCQHWGNDPDTFFDGPQNPPGARLLAKLNNGTAATYASNGAEIARLVGVREAKALKNPPATAVSADRTNTFAVYHDPDGLKWDYVVDFPSHQVIVTDSRTWRSFPNGEDEPGELMPKDQIRRQVANATPATGDRPLFVIISTNAPPSPIVRFGERNPWLAHRESSILDDDPNPDLWDSWELPSPPLDRLLVALSDRIPLLKDQATGTVRRGSAILLSGDVHASYATRLLFSGPTRFEDTKPQAVNMVVAQLVSSSFRNQIPRTLQQHAAGYSFPHWAVGDTVPEGYVGWNLPAGVTQTVANTQVGAFLYDCRQTGPGTRGKHELDPAVTITLQPDYGYRFDYIAADQEHPIPDFAKNPLPPPTDPQKSAERFRQITANYRDFVTSDRTKREIVGVTNLCEVTLGWDPKDDRQRFVHQTSRWYGGKDGKTVMLTTHSISLNPDDNRFKMSDVIKPLGWTKPLAWAP